MQEMMTTNQRMIETKMDTNLREIVVEMKGRRERTAGQEATGANLEKMEPNPGGKGGHNGVAGESQ
jgi:hypothetical protein